MQTPSLFSAALLLSPVLAGGMPRPEDTVPPAIEPSKLENFTWADPFSSPKLANFEAACESKRTFTASEYQLHDLQIPEPKGLQPYSEALKEFFGGRPYPGGWDGIDAHRYERNLLKMEYADVPVKVREWIEEEERSEGPGKGLFAVYQKPAEGETVKKTAKVPPANADHLRPLDQKRAVIFAPGAVYETLPLWVAEGSKCEETLTDLTKYGPKLVDGGVVAWPTDYTTPKRSSEERKIEFTIKAQVLSAKAGAHLDKDGQDAVKTDSKDEL
ncbi:hypothetical protein J7T55_013270 [Diaporthe amygdali]|uniref:uncharacterized protein n=1 Tax=Phomopsis amygdali TaxID=1214568 RepID=UPI0022FEBD88|nr:uncharacterized protein J7T55_013270 [Diaporthe amygdali]KAJ0119035.1 hypothetical protein J7T55_013270 [Diaporthe amygdali]